MNYTTLTNQIKAYANRDNPAFIEQIPNFIQQGIDRLYSEAKNIGFEIVLIGDVDNSQNEINKPENWRETISFQLYTDDQKFSKFLFPRSYEFCKSYWPDQTLTAIPEFYSYFDNYTKFFISPTADKAYKYKLIYMGLPLFNNESQGNFLTQRYPRLLFYACMLEAMPFLKDDERLGAFEQLYSSSLTDINRDSAQRYVDRTSERDKD
jgi:hypothetical protein